MSQCYQWQNIHVVCHGNESGKVLHDDKVQGVDYVRHTYWCSSKTGNEDLSVNVTVTSGDVAFITRASQSPLADRVNAKCAWNGTALEQAVYMRIVEPTVKHHQVWNITQETAMPLNGLTLKSLQASDSGWYTCATTAVDATTAPAVWIDVSRMVKKPEAKPLQLTMTLRQSVSQRGAKNVVGCKGGDESVPYQVYNDRYPCAPLGQSCLASDYSNTFFCLRGDEWTETLQFYKGRKHLPVFVSFMKYSLLILPVCFQLILMGSKTVDCLWQRHRNTSERAIV